MVLFCKKTDSPINAKAILRRGLERNDYLVQCVVHTMRKHKGITTPTYSHEQKHNEIIDHYQWSKFEMEKELGKSKSDLWIQSGKLEWVPDRVTGSQEEDLQTRKIYIYIIYNIIYILFLIYIYI